MVSENWKKISQAQLHKHHKTSTKLDDTTNTGASSGASLWFDVKPEDLDRSQREKNQHLKPLDLFPGDSTTTKKDSHGKYVAVDCEMVGIGPDGRDSALARISLVNWHGQVLYDTFVQPNMAITDYRTGVSGVTAALLKDAPDFGSVQGHVAQLLHGKVLVGHALKNDLRVLMLGHPRRDTRDTSKYRPFRRLSRGKNPALRNLAAHFLGITIQKGSHDSADDARVAMLLYRKFKDEWENYLFRQEGKVFKQLRKEKKRKSNIKSA